jgi:hypothetical protein
MAVVQIAMHNGSALGILMDGVSSIATNRGVPSSQIVKRTAT